MISQFNTLFIIFCYFKMSVVLKEIIYFKINVIFSFQCKNNNYFLIVFLNNYYVHYYGYINKINLIKLQYFKIILLYFFNLCVKILNDIHRNNYSLKTIHHVK